MFSSKLERSKMTIKSEFSKLKTSTDENPLSSAYCTDKTICSVNFTLFFSMKLSISS